MRERVEIERAREILAICAAYEGVFVSEMACDPECMRRAAVAMADVCGIAHHVIRRVTGEVEPPSGIADDVRRERALQVLRNVAQDHGLTMGSLRASGKAVRTLEARRCAARRLRDDGYTLQEIANVMGRSDHTTAINWLRPKAV